MVTKHFKKRSHERAGIKKRSINRFYKLIFEKGICMESCKHKATLYDYLKRLVRENKYAIIYNNYIVIYSMENPYDPNVITILHLPRKFHSTIKSLKKEGYKYDYRESKICQRYYVSR